MQRDAYAALIKRPNTRKIPVRIMQLNGRVSHENLVPEFFQGYKLRRLALMTYTAGQDPRLPRLPHDTIVATYEAFRKIHQPHFMYQLMPLLTADVEAFAAMQSVCSSAGSPFTIQDRVDAITLNFRIGNMCTGRDKICDFFKDETAPSELLMPTTTRRLPITSVIFQGILFREQLSLTVPAPPSIAEADGPSSPSLSTPTRSGAGAVLITTHDTCSEAIIHQRALMTRLFRSSLYPELIGNATLANLVHGSTYQWHVMAMRRRVAGGNGHGGDQRMRARLIQQARKENLLLYEKVDEGVYEYVQQ